MDEVGNIHDFCLKNGGNIFGGTVLWLIIEKALQSKMQKKQVSTILGVNLNCETSYLAPNNEIDDASIFWLYCWANNGDCSERASKVARKVWNDIFF